MKGKARFSAKEADKIRAILFQVRTAERNEQKKLRSRLRDIGFYISDWDISRAPFTCSGFNRLVRTGQIIVVDTEASATARAAANSVAVPAHDHEAPRRRPKAPARADLVASAVEALTKPRHRLVDAPARIKSAPGLYAIYGDLQTWRELQLRNPPDDRPLYVGKAEQSLLNRDVQTHFGNGRTGSSTVRRSVAALLRDTLGLRGIPRNTANPERPANFGLSAEHDRQLTDWMRSRLLLATWPRPLGCSSLLDLEKKIITDWLPPLNLKHNSSSPWKDQLSAARRVMADDARAWARDHG